MILTVIVPYYRNPLMLEYQLRQWENMPESFRFLLVDDCSPEPALPVIEAIASAELKRRIFVYRVKKDIPWNQHGARNLGAQECETQWMLMTDIDHVLCGGQALSQNDINEAHWYRFRRFVVDGNGNSLTVKPAPNVFLCTKDAFWNVGGYNEDFCGCYGGDTPFLARMKLGSEPIILPHPVGMEVHTSGSISDAATKMDRDLAEYKRRLATVDVRAKPENPIRFPWERQL